MEGHLKWQKFDSLSIPIEDYILKMTMQHFFPWCIYLMFFFFSCVCTINSFLFSLFLLRCAQDLLCISFNSVMFPHPSVLKGMFEFSVCI